MADSYLLAGAPPVNNVLRSSLKEVATSSLSEDAHPVLP